MKKLLAILFILLGLSTQTSTASTTMFQYPTPPDTMQLLQDRCDYIVSKFWERCNFNSAFVYEKELNTAFGDWVQIMPYASAEVVHNSIDQLLARFTKKGKEMLTICTMAENWLYSDTAYIFSEELYLPFAKAASTNKKIPSKQRAHFALQTKQLESSAMGAIVPEISIIHRDGSRGTLAEASGTSILLFFADSNGEDTPLTRTRLAADYNARELIKRGELGIVMIYPGSDINEWKASSEAPEGWLDVAMPDASEYFVLNQLPSFVFLNNKRKVLAKDIDVNFLLAAFQLANTAKK